MLILTSDQQVPFRVRYEDASGNPATIDGVPAFTVSDETMAFIELDSDGFGGMLVTTGALGSFQLNVTADVDLGEGVKPLIQTLEVEVVGGEAVVGVITTGEPILKLDEDLDDTLPGGDDTTSGGDEPTDGDIDPV